MTAYHSPHLSRRAFLNALGVLGAGIALRPRGVWSATEEKVLHFYNWDTYIGETTLSDFKKASGIEAKMDLYADNDELFAKLKTGNPGYDVIVPSHDFVERMITAASFTRMGWPLDLPWPLNLGSIIIAHMSFSFPFVAVILRARLAHFNREWEEVAKDLGANEWQTFWDIVIPFMKPGLAAGALLAFTLSLDDFVITFFTSGPGTVTFPVKVYSMVRFSVTPEVNAASTVLIVITLVLTTLALWLQPREHHRHTKPL